jgi:hypothetical protein
MIAGPRAGHPLVSHAAIARDFLTRFPEFAYGFVNRIVIS